MALVKCPECAGSVSSAAPVCPHCGYPEPARAAASGNAWAGAPPPSRGISPGWVIFGIVTVGMLVLGLLGVGFYRAVRRAQQPSEHPEELVDFVDSATDTTAPAPPLADSALELSAVETPPELLNRDEVASEITRSYPPLLRDAGVTGTVTLRMRVRSDGVVDAETIEVLETTHEAFGEAASRVAERLRFRPATVSGKPVAVWVTLPVTFQLRS